MTFLEKLKVKLQNFSKSRQLLLLDILDFLVDKGNMNIWSAVSSKKFFQALLDLLKTKDIPEVQMKLLGLIQKWGLNFEDKKNALPNFFSVYNKLRMNNVQFPSNFESNYQNYIDENNLNKNNYEKNSDNDDNYNDNNASDKEDDEIFYYMDSLKDVLKVPNFEHKYRRLVNFLVKMHDNIQMANLLIDNKEHGGLREIINTLREGNNTLIDTIQGGRLKDEKLMEITLGTTEDINQTLGRDEDIKNGYKPNKFKSYFVLNNVIRIKNKKNNNNHRNRAKSTKPKKNIQRNQEKYGIENNYYDKNKYKSKMGPKNADDIFDLFSASNPNNEPQNYSNNNRGNNNSNNNANNINNFFNSSQTQQLRNNPMNNFFNNNNNRINNNMNNMNNNNNTMFFNQNNNNNQFNQQQRPIMTNFDILEQKLNNLNIEQNQNNNYSNNFNNNINNNQNIPNMQYNQGFNNNNNNNNNLMSMLDQLGPVPQTNSNQLVPYIGSFNNSNNNNNNMNQNNFMNNNNNYGNNMGNKNMQFNNNVNMFNSQVINRGNNMNINNNNQMNMNRENMSQNMENNNWMNNQGNNNNQNNQQMNFEEMQKQQRLKELDDLF